MPRPSKSLSIRVWLNRIMDERHRLVWLRMLPGIFAFQLFIRFVIHNTTRSDVLHDLRRQRPQRPPSQRPAQHMCSMRSSNTSPLSIAGFKVIPTVEVSRWTNTSEGKWTSLLLSRCHEDGFRQVDWLWGWEVEHEIEREISKGQEGEQDDEYTVWICQTC